MTDDPKPQVFSNRWADAVGPGGTVEPQERCSCIARGTRTPQRPTGFHRERQDTAAPGWLRLLELVEEAAADGRAVFKPLVELTAQQRREVITLPPTIAKLTAVKHLVLYGSNLVRIPPEIGGMRSLVEFTPYTSYRLHWFPYELTRCPELRLSTVSTRALYGNHKTRPPFPALPDLDPEVRDASAARPCSVCDRPVADADLHQVWISLRHSGFDVLPLLVNACSAECVDALPTPPSGYVRTPHRGGPDLVQPARGR
jgi:hypothetical protein